MAYVNAVDALSNELKLVGFDSTNMYPQELRIFSVPLAKAIQKKAAEGKLNLSSQAPGADRDIEMNPIHLPKGSVGRLDSPR